MATIAFTLISQPLFAILYPVFALNGNINFGQSNVTDQDVEIVGGSGTDVGSLVESAGDVNNDGIEDFLVTAPGNDESTTYTYEDGSNIDATDYEEPVIEERSTYSTDGVSSFSDTFTADTGKTDSVLLVSVYSGNSGNIDTISYAGDNFTQVCQARATNDFVAEFWYLTSHALGSNTISLVAESGTQFNDMVIRITQVSGVDQANPISAYACNTGGSNWTGANVYTDASTGINSSKDEMILAGITTYSGSGTSINHGSLIPMGDMAYGGVRTAMGKLSAPQTVGATVDFSISHDWPWAVAAVSLNPSIAVPEPRTVETSVFGSPSILHSVGSSSENTTSISSLDFTTESTMVDLGMFWFVNYRSDSGYSLNNVDYTAGGNSYDATLVCDEFDATNNNGTAVYYAPIGNKHDTGSYGDEYSQFLGTFNGQVEFVFHNTYLLENVNQTVDLINGFSCSSGSGTNIDLNISNSDDSIILTSAMADFYDNSGSSSGGGWHSFTVSSSADVSEITFDFDWETDSYPSEGSVWLESPDGQSSQILDGNDYSSGLYSNESITTYDFNTAQAGGDWKIWIEDSYGDGGHAIYNPVITFGCCGGDQYSLPDSPGQYDYEYNTYNDGGSSDSGGGSSNPNEIYPSGVTMDDRYSPSDVNQSVAAYGHKIDGGISSTVSWYTDEAYPWVASAISLKGEYSVGEPQVSLETTSTDLVIGGVATRTGQTLTPLAGVTDYTSTMSGVFESSISDNDIFLKTSGVLNGQSGTSTFGYDNSGNTRWTAGATSIISSSGSTPTIYDAIPNRTNAGYSSVSIDGTINNTIVAVVNYKSDNEASGTNVNESHIQEVEVVGSIPSYDQFGNPDGGTDGNFYASMNNVCRSYEENFWTEIYTFDINGSEYSDIHTINTHLQIMPVYKSGSVISTNSIDYYSVSNSAGIRSSECDSSYSLGAPEPVVNYASPQIVTSNSSSVHMQDGVSSTSFNFETQTATDSVLAVTVAWNGTGLSSATFNGTPMTYVCDAGHSNYSSGMFYLANPSIGNYNLTVNFPGNTNFAMVQAIQLSGVDQTNPLSGSACASGRDGWTGSNSIPINVSMNLPSGENHFILSTVNTYTDFGSEWTPGLGITELYANKWGWTNSRSGYQIGTSQSETVSWTNNVDWPWGAAAASFAPSVVDGSGGDQSGPVTVVTGGTNSGEVYLKLGSASIITGDIINTSDFEASYIGESTGTRLGDTGQDVDAGKVVAALGDMNGDGFDDFAISDPDHENRGRVYIFFGKSSGWTMNQSVLEADAIITGEAVGDYFGYAIEGVGDINNDGFHDLVVSAPYHDNNGIDKGKIYVYLGKSSASWTYDNTAVGMSTTSLVGHNEHDKIGMTLTKLGNFTGTSYNDFAVGAPYADYTNGAVDRGFVYVFNGRTAYSWSQIPAASDVTVYSNSSFEGEYDEDILGTSISVIEDFNGDGRNDLAMGAPGHTTNIADDGNVYIMYGRLGDFGNGQDPSVHQGTNLRGNYSGSRAGNMLANPGDMNGDGIGDILVYTKKNPTTPNTSYVWLILGQYASWIDNVALGETFGVSLTSSFDIDWITGLGNINYDGYDDLAVGITSDGSSGKVHIAWGEEDTAIDESNVTTLTEGINSGYYNKVVYKQDGTPLIFSAEYEGGEESYRFASCLDATCENKMLTQNPSGYSFGGVNEANGVMGAWGYLYVKTNGIPGYISRDNAIMTTLSSFQSTTEHFSGVANVHRDLTPRDGLIEGVNGTTREDDTPFVAFECTGDCAGGNSLRALDCSDQSCSSATTRILDVGGSVGSNPSVAMIAGNRPVISYYGGLEGPKLYVCDDSTCATGNSIVLDANADGSYGEFTAMVIRNDGTPGIAYTAPDGLWFHDCDNATCTTGTNYHVHDEANGALSGNSSGSMISLDENGNPVIINEAARRRGSDTVSVFVCYNPECSEGRFRTLQDSADDEGEYATMTYDPVSKRYTIVYRNNTDGEVFLYHKAPTESSKFIGLSGSLDVKQISRQNKLQTLSLTNGDPQVDNFSTAVVDVRLEKSTGEPLSDLIVSFPEAGDVNLGGVSGDSDPVQGKAYIHGVDSTSVSYFDDTHSLYVPKLPTHGAVRICPDATQMSEVTLSCSNGFEMAANTTRDYNGDTVAASIVQVSGNYYWYVTGLRGTGGIGVSLTNGSVGLVVTPNASSINTTQEVVASWTPSGEFQAGDKIAVDFGTSLGFTLANTCATPTTDADGDGTPDGSAVVITNGSAFVDRYEYTFTANTTLASTNGIDFCMNVSSPGFAGNYIVDAYDQLGGFGSAFYYVGSENQLNVIGKVDPVLSMVVRNSLDTTDQVNLGGRAVGPNLCDLGNLSDAGVQECSYRLKIATNASSGYSVTITTDGSLRKGTDFITNIIEDSGVVTAGQEGYGLSLQSGDCTEQPFGGNQELTDFDDDDSPLATGATNGISKLLYRCLVPNNPGTVDTVNTALITHRAEADAATPAGTYNQLVTYTVSASF